MDITTSYKGDAARRGTQLNASSHVLLCSAEMDEAKQKDEGWPLTSEGDYKALVLNWWREERDLYLSVVTGNRYRAKTPPGQQPTNPCARNIAEGDVSTIWSTGVVVRCLAAYSKLERGNMQENI